MSHSKDSVAGVVAGESHSKDWPKDAAGQQDLVTYVVGAWGRLHVPTLSQASADTLVDLATQAVAALTLLDGLTEDESERVRERINKLRELAGPPVVDTGLPDPNAVGLETGETVHAILWSTLPDPAAAASWDVLRTAVVAAAAVLGGTIINPLGIMAGAKAATARWRYFFA